MELEDFEESNNEEVEMAPDEVDAWFAERGIVLKRTIVNYLGNKKLSMFSYSKSVVYQDGSSVADIAMIS